MKVLVVVRHSPAQRFLVELPNNKVIEEVSGLIAKRRHSKAIVTALTKGRLEREVHEKEAPTVNADMVLTEKGVCYIHRANG